MASKLPESPWQEKLLKNPRGQAYSFTRPHSQRDCQESCPLGPCPQLAHHLQDASHLSVLPLCHHLYSSTISSVFHTSSFPSISPYLPPWLLVQSFVYQHCCSNLVFPPILYPLRHLPHRIHCLLHNSTMLAISISTCVITAACIAASTSALTASSSSTICYIFASSCVSSSTSPMTPTHPLPHRLSTSLPFHRSLPLLLWNSPPHLESAQRAIS